MIIIIFLFTARAKFQVDTALFDARVVMYHVPPAECSMQVQGVVTYRVRHCNDLIQGASASFASYRDFNLFTFLSAPICESPAPRR